MVKLTFRIWLLIFVLICAVLAIAPWKAFEKGIEVKSVDQNSSAYEAGLRQGMIITSINGNEISTLEDFSSASSKIPQNESKITITAQEGTFIFLGDSLPITVSEISNSRIKTGLDLSGGARALIKPEVELDSAGMSDLIALTSERLNTYGLKDITIKQVSDLSGNNFMLVEVAGATPSELQDLVGEQGKFEAKIGNETVFVGGDKDITSVCRNDATCSGIESCNSVQEGEYCKFRFVIYLSEEAAKKHAAITSNLGVNSIDSGRYLDQPLDLYLDDVLVDSLLISEDLKGRETTQVQIQGSGSGADRETALKDAKQSMQKLQTILITGSLPYKLEIVKLDSISSVLGKEFTKNLFYLAMVVFAIISLVIFVKYRKIKITLSVILTMFSEAFITLGIASLISWNLDAPSIAGIIAGMGTGVNDQIVIIDEAVSTSQESLKEKIKRALFIVFGAFFTIVAAMLPLFWAGAGMLKGFALTTIISVSVGILITRPAFADILKKISE